MPSNDIDQIHSPEQFQATRLILNPSEEKKLSPAIKMIEYLNGKGIKALLYGGACRDLFISGKNPYDYDLVINCKDRVDTFYKAIYSLEEVNFYPYPDLNKYFFAEYQGVKFDFRLENGETELDLIKNCLSTDFLQHNVFINGDMNYYGNIDVLKSDSLFMVDDPDKIFKEDPVRILRTLRISEESQLNLSKKIETSITRNASRINDGLLDLALKKRLLSEFKKIFSRGYANSIIYRLINMHVFPSISSLITSNYFQHFTNLLLLEFSILDVKVQYQQFNDYQATATGHALIALAQFYDQQQNGLLNEHRFFLSNEDIDKTVSIYISGLYTEPQNKNFYSVFCDTIARVSLATHNNYIDTLRHNIKDESFVLSTQTNGHQQLPLYSGYARVPLQGSDLSLVDSYYYSHAPNV